METTYAWAPITKTEELDDGTLMVYGPATDAGLDRDKQRMNQEWLDKAMPQWMAEGGNIREQHDSKRAVGVSVGLTKDEGTGAHLVAACVVDPIAIKKCLPGPNGRPPVLKGFSIGVKEPMVTMGKADAPNGEIVGGSIIEVSLVDRPSNPRTMFTMVKADGEGDLLPVEDAEVVEADEPPAPAVDPEIAAKAETIAARVATLVPDLVKQHDESADIAGAQEAITLIARLIQSEAGQLAEGRMEEARDISILLDALRALDWFICREKEQQAPAMLQLADKTTPDEGASTTQTPDLVKAAIAEAIKPYEEGQSELRKQFEALKAEMAALPQPGGPVLTRTDTQASQARTTDANQLRAEAQQLLSKADQTSDATLAAGWRDRARELLAKAAA